jgi:hypothetical protein
VPCRAATDSDCEMGPLAVRGIHVQVEHERVVPLVRVRRNRRVVEQQKPLRGLSVPSSV